MKGKRTIMDGYKATVHASPAVGFGTSSRAAPAATAAEAPGPGAYRIRSTLLGDNPDSRIKSTPRFSMRGREKFGSPDARAIDPTATLEPGPGHYRAKILNDRERRPPSFSFPKGSHPRTKAKFMPAPGQYETPSAMGRQALSTRKSSPAPGFGKGKRPPLLLQSTADVGPGEYGPGESACFRQLDSRRRSCRSTKFGTGGRHKPAMGERQTNDDVPGPGTYRLPSGICGAGPAYPYKATPKVSMSGRNSFTSPLGW